MPRVAFFELHAENVDRATKFYHDVFGWNIRRSSAPEDYWLVTTGESEVKGINGGMIRRQDPQARTTFNINVSSIDKYVAKVTAHGGAVVTPKTPVPGFGYLAYVRDTEDVVFGLFQPDMNAK